MGYQPMRVVVQFLHSASFNTSGPGDAGSFWMGMRVPCLGEEGAPVLLPMWPVLRTSFLYHHPRKDGRGTSLFSVPWWCKPRLPTSSPLAMPGGSLLTYGRDQTAAALLVFTTSSMGWGTSYTWWGWKSWFFIQPLLLWVVHSFSMWCLTAMKLLSKSFPPCCCCC